MKIKSMITAFIFLAPLGYSQDDKKDLLQIREWYKEINTNISQYRKVESPDIKVYKDLNPDHYSLGAGIYRSGRIDMITFFDGTRLVKIILIFHGDREDLISEYYIQKAAQPCCLVENCA